ncbi:MAG: 30S ribosome-binding factor RbfA [Bacillota bacterium]
MPNIPRLESDIERAITRILREDAKDPDIGFITVTDVELTNDLSYLTIHYTVLEDSEHSKETVKNALERSNKFLRTALAQKVHLRKMPELRFRYDVTLDRAIRIKEGLDKVMKKDSDKDGEK